MPATLAPHPSLSPPVILGSYTRPAPHTRAGISLIHTHSASSSRVSHASLGEVIRVLQNGSVRRARGLAVTSVAGNSVSLVETGNTHTTVQSFPLALNAQPCTPPLTVIRPVSSRKNVSVRTTYIGVAGQYQQKSAARETEIWAWVEVINKEDESASSSWKTPQRLVTRCDGNITSLHALSSGDVLLRSSEGHCQILSHGLTASKAESKDDVEDEAVPTSITATPLPSADEGASAATGPSQIVHSLSVLDASASSQIFGGRLPRDGILATIVTCTSKARTTSPSPSSYPGKDASSPSKASTEKRRGRRKTAMEVIDDVEGGEAAADLIPFGDLSLEVYVLSTDGAGERKLLNGPTVTLDSVRDASQVADVHLYHDGSMSILTRSGDLLMSQLRIDKSLQPTLSPSRTLSIAHVHSGDMLSRPASIVRLSSSHLLIVLVAQGGPSDGRMTALIWDTELEALLVASDWSIPSSTSVGLADANRHISVSASRVGRSQVLVHYEFRGKIDGQEQIALAAVWALPFSIPAEGSVLRHALGKAALTSTWSKPGSHDTRSSENAKTPTSQKAANGLTSGETQLVRDLESISQSDSASAVALEQKASEMETKFTAYISEETTRLRQSWERERLQVAKDKAQVAPADSDSDDSDEEDDEGDKKPEPVAAEKSRAPKLSLTHSFVTSLLQVSLPASTQRERPYARKIVSYLVERKAVSCGMLSSSEQSLLGRLQARNDWTQIMGVVRTVTDLGEVELVELLKTILHNRNQADQSTASANSRPPTADVFLSLFITMAVSRPLLRSTLHGHITDSKDVCLMLDTTTQWLKGRYYEPLDVDSFPQIQSHKGAGGADAAGSTNAGLSRSARRKRLAGDRRQQQQSGTQHITVSGASSAKAPPTKALVLFATDLIDIYFPLLLNTPTAHRSLHALSQAITAHLILCDELSMLRGPLDAYARLESDRKRVTEEMNRRAAVEKFRDPRQARAAAAGGNANAGAGAATGANAQPLQARAETGGGMGVPDLGKSARLRAFEASALVGPHTVETLEI